MAYLVGERRTIFWGGDKYVFERVSKEVWMCIYKEASFVPAAVMEALEQLIEEK